MGSTSFEQSIVAIDGGGDDDIGDTEPGTPDAEQPSKCTYDIKVTGIGGGDNFYECKSWGKTTIDNFFISKTNRAQFTNQFMTYLGNITDLKQLHYMFDGKRKFNSGFVGRDKVKEMILAILRDNPIGIYRKKPTLFNVLFDENGNQITDENMFRDFINNNTFDLKNKILDFVDVY